MSRWAAQAPATVEPGLDSMVGTTVQLAAWLWEEGAPYSLVFPSCSRWHCTVHGLGEANRGHHRRGERPALQGHGLRFHETLVVGRGQAVALVSWCGSHQTGLSFVFLRGSHSVTQAGMQ